MPEIIREEVSDEWFVSRLDAVNGGLNFDKSVDLIPDDNLVQMTNIRPEGSIIRRDTGYKNVQIAGATTTLVNNEIAAATALEVVATTTFTIGEAVFIDMDDGTIYEDVIANITAGPATIHITTGLPSAASIGKEVSNEGNPLGVVLGTPRKTYEFKFNSGVTETLLVTDVTMYVRRNLFWSLVPLAARGVATLVNNELFLDTVMEVTSTVGFQVGGPVTIELDIGSAYNDIILSIVAGVSITLTGSLPSAASIGNNVTSGGVATTVNANEIAGATVINVPSVVGFEAGNILSIALDDGAEHVTTVVSVAPLAITILVGIPSAASIGNAVTEGMLLAGTVDNEVVFTAVSEGNNPWIVFTNGIDPVARYNGTDVDPVKGLNGLEGDPLVNTCRTVVNHTGHLVLGGPTEIGALIPDKVRWADTNNPIDWLTGNAGFELLRDTRDDVVAMLQLGQEVAIYRSRSIIMMEFVEDVNLPQIFFFRPVVFGRSEAAIGVGAVSANAVTPVGSGHILLSHDGVYQYTGGLSIQLLSLKVDDMIFAAGGEIDPLKLHRAFVQFIDARNEVMIAYVSRTGTYPQQAVMLNLETGAWWKRSFTREMTSAESHVSSSGVTIEELEGSIAEQSWRVGSGISVIGSPVIFLTSTTGGNSVYEYDFVSTSDAGTAISWRVSTKKWKAFFKRMRWQWHQFKLGGENIFVAASTGESSFFLGEVSPGTIKSQRFMADLIGESIQYEFSGNGAFEMGDLAFAAREETTDFVAA